VTLLGLAASMVVSCSGDGPGVAHYSDFRDNQSLPLADQNVMQGGDTVQQAVRGGAARADQSTPNYAQHAVSNTEYAAHDHGQALPTPGGGDVTNDDGQPIDNDDVNDDVNDTVAPGAPDVSSAEIQNAASRCSSLCDPTTECGAACLTTCTSLALAGCTSASADVTSCDCESDPEGCSAEFDDALADCFE